MATLLAPPPASALSAAPVRVAASSVESAAAADGAHEGSMAYIFTLLSDVELQLRSRMARLPPSAVADEIKGAEGGEDPSVESDVAGTVPCADGDRWPECEGIASFKIAVAACDLLKLLSTPGGARRIAFKQVVEHLEEVGGYHPRQASGEGSTAERDKPPRVSPLLSPSNRAWLNTMDDIRNEAQQRNLTPLLQISPVLEADAEVISVASAAPSATASAQPSRTMSHASSDLEPPTMEAIVTSVAPSAAASAQPSHTVSRAPSVLEPAAMEHIVTPADPLAVASSQPSRVVSRAPLVLEAAAVETIVAPAAPSTAASAQPSCTVIRSTSLRINESPLSVHTPGSSSGISSDLLTDVYSAILEMDCLVSQPEGDAVNMAALKEAVQKLRRAVADKSAGVVVGLEPSEDMLSPFHLKSRVWNLVLFLSIIQNVSWFLHLISPLVFASLRRTNKID